MRVNCSSLFEFLAFLVDGRLLGDNIPSALDVCYFSISERRSFSQEYILATLLLLYSMEMQQVVSLYEVFMTQLSMVLFVHFEELNENGLQKACVEENSVFSDLCQSKFSEC